MFKPTTSVCGLLLYILSTAIITVHASDKNYDSLEKIIATALHRNPNLAALDAGYQAMLKIPAQKSALPEPSLSLKALNIPIDSFAFDRTPMTQFQIGITQSLPYPGKLSLAQQTAEQEALAVGKNTQNERRLLALHISRLWWQLVYLDKALRTVKNNSDLLKQFVEIAQTKYQIGQGQQQDVLLAQVEVNRLLDSESRLLSQRNSFQAQINQLMGNIDNKPIHINPHIPEQLPEIDRTQLDFQKVEQLRPDFLKAHAMIKAAKTRLDLAKKSYYPDFKLGAAYGWRETETDFANILFSMNLPINTANRQEPFRDQRNQELLHQKYRLQDMRNQLAAEIDTAIFNYQQSKKQAKLYKNSILPQSKQTVDAMLAGYQVNKVDFLKLIRSQITLFNYETQYWQALTTAKQALAEFNTAMGEEMQYE